MIVLTYMVIATGANKWIENKWIENFELTSAQYQKLTDLKDLIKYIKKRKKYSKNINIIILNILKI